MSVDARALTFNDLLALSGIAEDSVLVFRHRPYEAALNATFGELVNERADLFDCYQGTHGPNVEAALGRARYVASFIRHTPGTALFVGLCEVASSRRLTFDEYLARPAHQELVARGMIGHVAAAGRNSLLEFSLPRTAWHDSWIGRLIIRWPGLERSWYRWAHRNVFPVEAIAQENLLRRVMPEWDQLSIPWAQLDYLPSDWKMALAHWRGVYLIVDDSDGKQYVGSAYGGANILQRWREYARSGHGGNKLLRRRDPAGFRFSILQRVSPDLPEAEVVAIERSLKLRLRTLSPQGLNED